MTAGDLLKAERVNMRQFRADANIIKRGKLVVITRFGKPVAALVPWKEMVDLVNELEKT